MLWRVYDEMHPAVTVLAGRMENVSGLKAPHMIEDDLRGFLRANHRAVWEKIGEISRAARPPATPSCGRLYCPTAARRHSHRAYKPGDVVALTAGDPQHDPQTWPFPFWAVLGVRTEDEVYRDGICIEFGVGRDRRFVGPHEIRRLRGDEMVIGPSTW
ncbi:hypothetical protein KBI5_24675 [Frankia sp. KB5]|nr:hypothetical protein KBI5_24675 [Frankia sp. KB5]